MQGEEMEQHLSDVMRAHTGTHSTFGAMLREDRGAAGSDRLEQAADTLLQAAQMMVGQLRVAGVPDVAGVMGDVVGQVQRDRQQAGESANTGVDHLQIGQRMAQVLGVTPQEGGGTPIQRDLARFGLFVDQALRLGLTPQQTEQVVREVQSSPEGRMQPQTRDLLDKQVQISQGVSWVKARNEVDGLERSARMLPNEILAFGAISVPQVSVEPAVNINPNVQVNVQAASGSGYDDTVKKQSAMDGSGSTIGDNS
jgi:hypothetical protein